MNEGGPAFPRPAGWNGLRNIEEWSGNEAERGMSLRDYLAAFALQGIFTAGSYNDANGFHLTDDDYKSCAQHAYRFADAMLAERDRERQ